MAYVASRDERAAKARAAIQLKSRVSSSRDPQEHEADRMADQVMGAALPSGKAPCPACRDDIHRSASTDPQLRAALSLSGDGRPLDDQTRAFMEPRFGHDLSQVRIHSDDAADRASQALEARAFTVGRDVAFARGEYQPSSSAGRRLLAHELTHVIQGGAEVRRQPAPARSVTRGMSTWERVVRIMCRQPTMAAAFARIADDGVRIVLFNKAFDKWRYDDGHVEENEITGLRGNTDRQASTIRLQASLGAEQMAVTLFHELQHWIHGRDPAGPTGLESEVQARIATEQLAIERGRPPTVPGYRTADGRVDEAAIRASMASSPHYSPTGRRRIGRRYEGENTVTGTLRCPPVGDFPLPTGDTRVA